VQPTAVSGTWLDDRYRLDELLHQNGPDLTLWRATDEVLGRPVAVRIATGRTEAQRDALTAAATRAGQVSDSRWVRVLDVGSRPAGAQLTVWVVTEWVDGPSLATIVKQGAMREPVATTIVASCAQAVSAAQAAGASHGALHPDEVLLPADGNPRLTGLELSLAWRPAPAVDDTQALGGLLYTAVTGRWPLPGWAGLPAPSRGDDQHPRKQRGSVCRELDEIVARALSGGYPDAAALGQDLAGLPMAPLHPAPVDPDERRDNRWRRVAWRVIPPLLVAAVGFGAWTLGSALGRIPGPARAVAPSFPQPRQSTGTSAAQVVWSTPPRITSFDPEGDGAEDPGGVGLAVDDDPSTQWTTDTYVGNPVFGGLKTGVGLLLDLRRPTTVDLAQLLLSAPGANLEIRAGSVAPRQASDLPIVATRTDSPAAVRLKLASPVRARYWLVWLTSLPKSGSGYRLGVAEIALLH
jgi:hypothetical protein